ncbi:MAG: V-type ATP synthase subunit A, partial [Clostridiales bacterium]|nr:V-type ATP synthase subunit A [Clostridiales bacterium]
AAKSIREDYLHQNAFHETDNYTSPAKQFKMLKLIIDYYRFGTEALERNCDLDEILNIAVREKIGRSKYIPESEIDTIDAIEADMKAQLADLKAKEDF